MFTRIKPNPTDPGTQVPRLVLCNICTPGMVVNLGKNSPPSNESGPDIRGCLKTDFGFGCGGYPYNIHQADMGQGNFRKLQGSIDESAHFDLQGNQGGQPKNSGNENRVIGLPNKGGLKHRGHPVYAAESNVNRRRKDRKAGGNERAACIKNKSDR